MVPSPWPAAAQSLRLSFVGLGEDQQARFFGEQNGQRVHLICRPEGERFRWQAEVLCARFPRGVCIVRAAEPQEQPVELVTGDREFDQQVRVLGGGAGVLAMLRLEMRRRLLELYTETEARIAGGRMEIVHYTDKPYPGALDRHLESALWIGRRLAHPLTITGLVDNVLDDPLPEVRMTNLRMLVRVDPEALERLPTESQGIDLTLLLRRARLEMHAAGRLSVSAPDPAAGALSEVRELGSVSLEEREPD